MARPVDPTPVEPKAQLRTVKVPPLVTVALLGGAMCGVARIIPNARLALPAGRIVATGLILTGLAIAATGVVSFRRAKTTVNPLQPSAASTLVRAGIYRFTRNPMYLGMLLTLIGWAVFLANGAAFLFPLVYVPLMNCLQINREEKALAAKFGAEFAEYQSEVRRWL